MSNFAAVYDACVLYPAPLRDLLMELALTDLFRAQWSEEIHKEWIRNVLKNRPDLAENQLLRTKTFMDANVRDALVTDFESLRTRRWIASDIYQICSNRGYHKQSHS